jgi:hypothetical protein
MDIMLVFETSGVGSIPAWPAKIMYFIPITTKRVFSFHPNPNVGNFWGVVDSTPYLKMLGLEDLINDVYTLSIWLGPNSKDIIHKDQRLDGTGAIWSLVTSPIGHENVSIEIFDQIADTTSAFHNNFQENNIPLLHENNAKLVDQWSMQNGSCIFDAYNCWHTVVNSTDQFKNIISIRSESLKLEKILKRVL